MLYRRACIRDKVSLSSISTTSDSITTACSSSRTPIPNGLGAFVTLETMDNMGLDLVALSCAVLESSDITMAIDDARVENVLRLPFAERCVIAAFCIFRRERLRTSVVEDQTKLGKRLMYQYHEGKHEERISHKDPTRIKVGYEQRKDASMSRMCFSVMN